MRRALLIPLTCVLTLTAYAAPPMDLWEFWNQYDPDRKESVDHSAWQSFLDRYLTTTDDGSTRLSYKAVTPVDRAALRQYLDSLAAIDPRRLDRDEQFAYWVNLYNALTVDVVLRNPGKNSIKRMGRGLFSSGPWDDPLIEIAGRPVTLNDIEHRILRPIWKDHRIHFAVNCASLGCPDLALEAYTANNFTRLLDAGEAAYLGHSRGLRFLPDGTLALSSIFDWYGRDFAADRAGLLRYLARQREDVADRLLNYEGRIRFEYDWSLNSAE